MITVFKGRIDGTAVLLATEKKKNQLPKLFGMPRSAVMKQFSTRVSISELKTAVGNLETVLRNTNGVWQ